MSKSQKVLMVFSVLELLSAISSAVNAVKSGNAAGWLSVVVALLAAYLLFAAAKDASKIMGAWIILLVSLILNALSLILAVTGLGAAAGAGLDSSVVSAGTAMAVGYGIIIALNVVAFIAANNIKKQRK